MILPFRRALRGLREHTYLAMVNTGVITAAIVLLGVYALVVVNLQAVVSGWQHDVHVSAYFENSVSAEDQAASRVELAGRAEVKAVELVTHEMAAAWMRERMPEVGPMLDELGEEALPASLEVTLNDGHTSPAAMDTFAASLRETGRFSEVDYGREWVERAAGFLRTLTLLGAVLGVILIGAALFLVGNTIHLVVYARRDELEILRLVGATDGYIVTPFVIEGALEGLVGSVLALVALELVHQGVMSKLHEAVPLTFDNEGFRFLPGGLLVGLVLVAVGTGVLAAFVAVRRFLRRLA
ncbi:cell division protein FtsX [Deltaproteobacteria bacterium]|nr:cell division protein FtsX [Deltaproteobacteria bacterium]